MIFEQIIALDEAIERFETAVETDIDARLNSDHMKASERRIYTANTRKELDDSRQALRDFVRDLVSPLTT